MSNVMVPFLQTGVRSFQIGGLAPKPIEPSRHAPLPTDEHTIEVWARANGVRWTGWGSLGAVNVERRLQGRIEFAQPGSAPPAPKPLPRPRAKDPLPLDGTPSQRVMGLLMRLAMSGRNLPSSDNIAAMCGIRNCHSVASCLNSLCHRRVICWTHTPQGHQSILIVQTGDRIRTDGCPVELDPVSP